jgi:hypothetical protein
MQLRYKDRGMKQYWPSSTISPESAEARADMGKAADFWQMQVFDGPAPETINGRMAMLGESRMPHYSWLCCCCDRSMIGGLAACSAQHGQLHRVTYHRYDALITQVQGLHLLHDFVCCQTTATSWRYRSYGSRV